MSPLKTSDVLREHARASTEVLDGFRGYAILLVLVYHTWLFSWLTPAVRAFGHDLPLDVFARTGYLGVELFFVISGFVLFFPAIERYARGQEPVPLPAFASRRALKILPSYALALVATAWAVRSLGFDVPLPAALAEHALMIQNFFANDFGQANSVFWSLAIEVQFYLVFPLLARAFVRRPSIVAGAMFAIALGDRYGVAHCCLQNEIVNRQLPAFLDVFGAGMLCAYAVARVRSNERAVARLRPAYTLGALVATLAALALLRSANGIQYDVAGRETWILGHRTLVALCLGALVFTSAFAVRMWRVLIANPISIALSLVSYNLYLWHTLVMIWLWKHHAIASATANPHDDERWKIAFIALGWTLSLTIATALTYFFERPLLGTQKPQAFAFDWRRLRSSRSRLGSPETRT